MNFIYRIFNPKRLDGQKSKKWICGLLIALSVICLSTSITLLYRHTTFKNKIINKEKGILEAEIKNAAAEINENLSSFNKIFQTIKQFLATKTNTKEEIENKLKTTVQNHPELFGISIAYEPFKFDPNIKLYAPFFHVYKPETYLTQVKETIVFKPIEKFYDYTLPKKSPEAPETKWYSTPLKKGTTWSDPMYGTATGGIFSGYATPFYNPEDKEKKTPIGIIDINYKMSHLKKKIASLNIGKAGYGFMLSKNGIFTIYPVEEQLKKLKSIFELAKEENNPKLKILGQQMTEGKEGFIEMWDNMSQKNCWVFFEPIPFNGWSLASVTFINEILGKYSTRFRQSITLITLSLMLSLIFLILFFICLFFSSIKVIWLGVAIISLLFSGEIVTIWLLQKNAPEKLDSTEVVGVADIKNFLKIDPVKSSKNIYVPTGIFINHIEFKDINHINITGNVWQKFYIGITDKIKKGFYFPKSIRSEIKEIYNYKQKNVQVIGYNFKCTLPQELLYHKYPIDHKNFIIQIKSEDIKENIILIPDFNSYTLISPKSFPGIEEKTKLQGWSLEQSIFSYKKHIFNTNFGLKELSSKECPLFYFNIIAKRNFLQPFLTRIAPLLIILILLFVCLLIPFGNYFFSSLSFVTLLLVGIIIAHVALRNSLPVHQFFYLEYFYFIGYLIVMFITLNLFKSRKNAEEQNKPLQNIFLKTLYWPLLLVAFLITTLIVFY